VNAKALEKMYGDEYPAVAVYEGTRMVLAVETRFTRDYRTPEAEMKTAKIGGLIVSRFMDGSASITLAELEREWPTWTSGERVDFSQSCSWLHKQADYPDMLRFIATLAEPDDWPAIAVKIASTLPSGEAFVILLRALRATDIGCAANVVQAIAITKHPDAEETLRRHLAAVWEHGAIWEDDDFTNWVAFDATTCIAHLIELGAPPADFDDKVRQMSRHVCAGNRKSCRNYLSKYYSWLK
jgi:hypothetical protein